MTDGPKVAPRTRRTNSLGRRLGTNTAALNGLTSMDEKLLKTSTEVSGNQQVNGNYHVSPTGIANNNGRIADEVERMDQSFFMMMKVSQSQKSDYMEQTISLGPMKSSFLLSKYSTPATKPGFKSCEC